MVRFLKSVFFLCFILGVLLGAQLFVYFSIVDFFSLTRIADRRLLYEFTAFIPMSFIAASVLGKMKENMFTRHFYLVSGILLGIGANMFLAAFFARIVLWVAGYTVGTAVDAPAMLAGMFFFFSLLFSAYGIWNAFHPITKRIKVVLPGLPEAWKGKRIVQLSDIHLGYIYQSGFMRRIVRQVNALHADMVVITGDLFDGMDGNLDDAVDSLNEIRVPYGVFFVNGNHETYFGLEKSFDFLKKTTVRILRDEVVHVGGLSILGIGYPEQGEKKDVVGIARALKPSWKGTPTILLYHAPAHVRDFQELGIHLQLSGHTHKGQIFPFNLITKIVHKGHDYGLYRHGDYTLYTTSGIGTWGPSMRLGNRPEIVEITLR